MTADAQESGWLLMAMLLLGGLAARTGWRCSASFSRPWQSWLAVVLGCLLLLAGWDALREVAAAPGNNWNGPRLLPAFTLTSPHQVYYGEGSGPVSGNIYGPGLALAYLPCTVFTEPESAIRWGSVLSVLWVFVPVLLLLRHGPAGQTISPGRLCLLGLGTYWLVTGPYWLRQVIFNVHADAPAIGLGLCACWCALQFAARKSAQSCWLTAMFIHASIATKQTMLPLLIALPLWLWLAGNRGEAKKLVTACLATGIVCWGIIGFAFGWQEIWFNLVFIPGHHPWYAGLGRISATGDAQSLNHLAILGEAFLDYALSNRLLWLVFISAWLLGRKYFPKAKVFITTPAGLLLTAGVLLVPMSLLGRVKVGGDYNAFSYATIFLSLAAVLMADTALRNRLAAWPPMPPLSPAARAVIWLASLSVLALTLTETARGIRAASRETVCNEQIAFETMKANPETLYFPWHPLAGLMAEGRLYHFTYGVYDRWLAGRPLSTEHFHAHLPARLEAAAVMKGSNISYLRGAYLKDFSQTELRADMTLLKRGQGSGPNSVPPATTPDRTN